MPNEPLLTRLEELLAKATPELSNIAPVSRIDDYHCAVELHNAAPALIAIARAVHDAKDCLACICDSCEALRSALAAVEE